VRELSYVEALREALREEMNRDAAVVLMGEDIGVYGGAFGVTQGLFDRFGPQRVMDTPISESSFTGVAIGAALAGLRPVVEIMFMDFMTLVTDQLVNQAAKLHYVFGREARCPLVVRTVAGAGRCYGPTHSQSFDAWFIHVPGLKVVAPATPADAKGMLKTAIRDDNPVLFIEHKLLYGRRGSVPARGRTAVPLGKARIARRGTDLTIVAWSGMVLQALQATAGLEDRDVLAEVVDLRSLNPMDTETVVESVRKTGRLLIAEEGCRTGGIGAEIGAQVFEHAFDYLDAPIRRVATPDIPIPAGPSLERAAIPDGPQIAAAALSLVDGRDREPDCDSDT